GGLLGVVLASAAVPTVVHLLPPNLPRAGEIVVDARVLALASLTSVLTGLAFGLLPLLRFEGSNAQEALRQSGRAVPVGQSSLRRALVVAQVSMALVLLAGAGLLTRSLNAMLQVAPGFRADHVLTGRLSLPPHYTNGYAFGTGARPQVSAFQ